MQRNAATARAEPFHAAGGTLCKMIDPAGPMPRWTASLGSCLLLGTAVAALTPRPAQAHQPAERPLRAAERTPVDAALAATPIDWALLDPGPATLSGPIVLAARVARTWVLPVAGSRPVSVALLDDDVRINLGPQALAARRAIVFIHPSADGSSHRVFAALESPRASSAAAPGGAFGATLTDGVLTLEAVCATQGDVRLAADVVRQGPPGARDRDDATLLRHAQASLAQQLAQRRGTPLTPPEVALPPGERFLRQADRAPSLDDPQAPSDLTFRPDAARGQTQADAPRLTPLFDASGVFYIAPLDRVEIRRLSQATDQAAQAPTEPADPNAANVALITGGVAIQYEDRRTRSTLDLRADRAVVFLRPGPLEESLARIDARSVLGIYLEGDVLASNGSYTLRSARVYYDVQANRATLIDAVFAVNSPALGTDLYLRAAAIRQASAEQVVATSATVANSAFFNPHLRIGASQAIITTPTGPDAPDALLDAQGVSVRAGGNPVFYLPRYQGDPTRAGLRSIAFSNSDRTGPVVTTRWDPYALFGIRQPQGLNTAVGVDYYTDRGVGLNTDLNWSRQLFGVPHSGNLTAYILPDDTGEDQFPSGLAVERDGEFRGLIRFDDRWALSKNWQFLAEGYYTSDEAFIPALFAEDARTLREQTARLAVQRFGDQSIIWAQAKAQTTDSIVNEYLLQSPTYTVDKLPEVGASAIAVDPLARTAPGILTYTWESSIANQRLRLVEVTPGQLGLLNATNAFNTFGVGPNQPISDAARGIGLGEFFVTRFDTRHELAAPFSLPIANGALRLRPFLTGRFTTYDTRFDQFRDLTGSSQDERSRFWGAAGITLSTSFQRVNNTARSELLDIHRLRHIVEPSLTLMQAEGTIDRTDLPIYDDEVESLLDGTIGQAALRQTWQTKRGGPGRWRSVDVLTLNAEYAHTSEEAGVETPIGRFDPARGELSVPGEFIRLDSAWQTTDTFAIAGETIYDLETRQQDRWSAGVLVQHSPYLTTTAELRYLNAQDRTFVSLGAAYFLGRKYRLDGNASYDVDLDEFQSVDLRLTRSFPNVFVGLRISHDSIRGDTSFGFVIEPARLTDRADAAGTAASQGFGL